jgi:hypothetical protein
LIIELLSGCITKREEVLSAIILSHDINCMVCNQSTSTIGRDKGITPGER